MHGDVEGTPSGVYTGRKLIPWRELFAALPADPVVILGQRGDDTRRYALPPGKLGALAEHLPVAISQDIAVAVQVADVEVDLLLGRVHVRKVDVFLDAGRVASPGASPRELADGAAVEVVAWLREEGGVVQDARIVLDAVARTPRRASAAEAALVGKPLSSTTIADAATRSVTGAAPLEHDRHKLKLVEGSVRALLDRLERQA